MELTFHDASNVAIADQLVYILPPVADMTQLWPQNKWCSGSQWNDYLVSALHVRTEAIIAKARLETNLGLEVGRSHVESGHY